MLLPPAAGAQLEALGEPQVVDFIVGGAQVAMDPRGRFALVWEKRQNVVVQMFDEDGRAAGRKFAIRDKDPQAYVTRVGPIVVDGSGSYLVSWRAVRGGGVEDLEHLLRARFYDARGRPQSHQIGLEASGPPNDLSVAFGARNRRGDAVLLWNRYNRASNETVLRAWRFDDRNGPVGGRMDLLPVPGGLDVAIDDLGRFVVVLAGISPSSRGTPSIRYFFQRFGRDGVKLGKRKLVTRQAQRWAAVGRVPSGEFAITWLEDGAIKARFYDPLGRPLRGAVRVAESADGMIDPPASMARDRFGNAVMVWSVDGPCCFPPPEIFARVYDRLGHPLGDASVLAQGYGAVSSGLDDKGRMIVAWAKRQGNHFVLVFQRFRLTCAPGYERRCP